MVSKVVINLLMQPANWAVRNSRVIKLRLYFGGQAVSSTNTDHTDLTVVTSCCVYDCTNRVKNGSVGTKARFSEYLCFGRGSRDATIT